jgi:hypothetical protein
LLGVHFHTCPGTVGFCLDSLGRNGFDLFGVIWAGLAGGRGGGALVVSSAVTGVVAALIAARVFGVLGGGIGSTLVAFSAVA